MSGLHYPDNQQADNETFLDIWQASCERYPDHAVIEDRGRLSTYREVDTETTQLADRLRREGLGKGDIVGIAESRGKDLLIALLGVMKTGAAFVILDLTHPDHRLADIIETAGVGTVLASDPASANRLLQVGPVVIAVGEAGSGAQAAADRVDANVAPDDLPYVIFTSGSTGKPKGVLLSHRGIPNLARHAVTYGITEASRVLMFSPVGFDAIIAEIIMTLQAGGCLVVLPDEDLKDIGQLEKALSERRIDVATLPPSLVGLLSPVLETRVRTC